MLGIPASNSIIIRKGLSKRGGAISVRNMAIPKLIGMLIRSAINVVIRVPIIGVNAPNFSVTGSQSVLVVKLQPKVLKLGALAWQSCNTMVKAKMSKQIAKNVDTT
jgi:hypothetical protein